MRVERYLVFAGESYYPSGGIHDIIGSVANLQDVVPLVKREKIL